MTPHIALLHVDSVPTEYFQDFVETLRSDKLELQVVERPFLKHFESMAAKQ